MNLSRVLWRLLLCSPFLAACGSTPRPPVQPAPQLPSPITLAGPAIAQPPAPVEAPADVAPGKPAPGKELDRFYGALKGLQNGTRTDHVRVLWMGDSHAAADFWSGELRDRLQKRFGNGGVGFVHLGYRDYRHDHLKVHIDGKWRLRPKRPATSEPEDDGAYGLGGLRMGGYAGGPKVRVELQDPGLTGTVNFDLCYRFRDPSDALLFSVDDAEPIRLSAEAASEPLTQIRHEVVSAQQAQWMTVKYDGGSADLCGVVIERDPAEKAGVVLDTLGINGARYSTALAWGEKPWTDEVARRKPDVMVLEYGTNEAGDFKPKFDQVAENIGKLMARVRSVHPTADCVVIGPTDRADAEDNIPPMHQAIERAAAETGCWFYNAHEAMGGKGAMSRMREEDRPRAQKDGIHLTIRGYREFGGKLYEALLSGFDGPPASAISRATPSR